MRNPVRIRVLFLFLIILLGCNPRPTLMSLNDSMSRSNKLLNLAGTRFYIAANLALKDSGSLPDVDSALEEVKSTFKSVKGQWDYQKLPKHPSKSAPTFVETYKEFLNTQETIITNMEKIVATLKDGSIDPATKQQVVADEFRQIGQEESRVYNQLTQAQSKFNSEHSFQTEPKNK